MYTIDAKRQQLIIGMLSLLFYAVTRALQTKTFYNFSKRNSRRSSPTPSCPCESRGDTDNIDATPTEHWKSEFTRQNIGSGIVIDTDGHIVTTTFEMEKPNKIEVIFKNEKVSAAQLVGIDTFTDIAVLESQMYTWQPHTYKSLNRNTCEVGKFLKN